MPLRASLPSHGAGFPRPHGPHCSPEPCPMRGTSQTGSWPQHLGCQAPATPGEQFVQSRAQVLRAAINKEKKKKKNSTVWYRKSRRSHDSPVFMKGLERNLAAKGLVKTHQALDMLHPNVSARAQITSHTFALLSPGLDISSQGFGSPEIPPALQTQPHELPPSCPEPGQRSQGKPRTRSVPGGSRSSR